MTTSLSTILGHNCKIYEFECSQGSNGKCISSNLFCDGKDHCGDRSDEPLNCTPCNKTYYGLTNKTYRLSVPIPDYIQEPFLCDLTFIANLGNMGELVQITYEKFSVGEFFHSKEIGCPFGFLSITDGMFDSGGQYCGSIKSRSVIISESNVLKNSLTLFQREQNKDEAFVFNIAYKFLSSRFAHARYDEINEYGEMDPVFLGRPDDSFSCSKTLRNCTKFLCRIQSPNYPGLIPRNYTCHYRIFVEDEETPSGKYSQIILQMSKNSNSQLYNDNVKSSNNSSIDECRNIDSVSIYDGLSSADPLLFRYCHGSLIPKIYSSSSRLLVVFQSTPYGIPSLSKFSSNGFRLEVSIIFSDASKSLSTFDKSSSSECNLNLRNKSGVVSNKNRFLPRNSTCIYNFLGEPEKEMIWITFTQFKLLSVRKNKFLDVDTSTQCDYKVSLFERENLLEEFCENHHPPLCEISSRTGCSLKKSFISSSHHFKLIETSSSIPYFSTIIHFELKYEFVSFDLPSPTHSPMLANPNSYILPYSLENSLKTSMYTQPNIYTSVFYSELTEGIGTFSSPQNVFYYGRGGQRSLKSSFRFVGKNNERILLKIHKLKLRNALPCFTVPHSLGVSQQFICSRPRSNESRESQSDSSTLSQITISEIPILYFPLPQFCFCSSGTMGSFLSNTSSLQLDLIIEDMTHEMDFKDFELRGSFEFIAETSCNLSVIQTGVSGSLSLKHSFLHQCLNSPFILEAQSKLNYLYLKVPGILLTTENPHCPSSNRILIHIHSQQEPFVFCPTLHGNYEGLYSSQGKSSGELGKSPQRILIELTLNDVNEFKDLYLSWFELSTPSEPSALRINNNNENYIPCFSYCSSLQGCLHESLMCDGVQDCFPHFEDESIENCPHFLTYSSLFLIGLSSLSALLFVFLSLLFFFKINQFCRIKFNISNSFVSQGNETLCNPFPSNSLHSLDYNS